MSGNLGDMIVTFSADISNLVSSVSQGQSLLADFASQAQDATAQIAALASDANVSDLTVQIDSAASSLSTLSTGVADSAAALTTMGDEAANAASSVQQIGPAANLSGFVSDIDVAQAQLVLLQSKAADAATALQEMVADASESGDFSGIADAQAQLVLLQAKAQDAAASLQELQTAESDTSGSSSFGDAISGMMGNLGGFGSAVGDGISSLLGLGGELGMAVMGFQMMGNMAQQTASALLTPAANAETTQLSFETLMHSVSGAKQEMENLNTYAASTPMQTAWVDQAAEKLLAFGFDTKSVIPDITAIGDSLSGLGKLSDTSLNSIIDIFGKIQAQGRLTAADMTQLSDWGVPAWQALSNAMGKPIPVLQQMVSKGLLPAKDALPALQKGMESVFGGNMQKQAQTLSGTMSTLSSDWQNALAKLGGPVLKIAEDGLGKLANILGSPQFQNWAASVGQAIANALVDIGNFVKNVVYPNFVAFGTYVGSLVPKVTPVFQAIWNGLQQVGNFLQQTFTPVWQQLVNTFNDQLVPAWNNFYNSIRPVMPELETAAKWIGEVLVGAIGLFVINLAGMLKDSIIVFGGIVEIVSGWVTYVSGYIAQFVDIVTGNWGKLNQDSATMANGMQAIWVGAWNAIDGIFGNAINGLIDQVNGWLSGMVSAFNAVSTAIGGPAMHFSGISHVSTIKLATPATQQATQQQTTQQKQAAQTAQNNPFLSWLNGFNQMIASASATANNTKNMSTSIPSAVSSAADTTSSAVSTASSKSAAAQQKAADAANAQRLKLSADQQKALADSSSSAVQQLVDKSKQAAAAGDMSTAAFYAQQADQLAAQQKSAATKAANQKKAAANKAARAKASAAKKAATAKAKAAAAAKKKTTTSRAGTTSRTSTRRTGTSTSSGSTTKSSTGTGSSGGTTLSTTTTTPAGTSVTATTTTPAGTASTGTPQTLTVVLEINGQDFGTAVMPFVMTAAMQKVRLKTGLKV